MDMVQLFEDCGLPACIVLGIFLIALGVQLWYYIAVYSLPLRRRHSETVSSPEKLPLSVIICARNEEKNLARFLPAFLEQDYPEFEVIVVNDGSTDDSEQLLSEMKARHKRLHYTNIPPSPLPARGKKLAVTLGIKAARHAHVVLSDADCYPEDALWLSRMAGHFGNGKRIVLGYGGYERRPGLLNLLIRFETLTTAMSYTGWALRGRPYMGVGRNLAYEKTLFFENKGFAKHLHLRSGDDDLFVNENASAGNTAVELSAESFTRSVPETRLKDWLRQKRRHLSAGTHYTAASRRLLAVEWSTRIIFYASFAYLAFDPMLLLPLSVVFALALIFRAAILKMNMQRFKEKYLLLPSLLLDPLLPLFLGLIWLTGIRESKRLWK